MYLLIYLFIFKVPVGVFLKIDDVDCFYFLVNMSVLVYLFIVTANFLFFKNNDIFSVLGSHINIYCC